MRYEPGGVVGSIPASRTNKTNGSDTVLKVKLLCTELWVEGRA